MIFFQNLIRTPITHSPLQFESPIHQLLVSADKVYTVFTNGEIEELQSALSTRRESKPGFLQEDEIITYVQIIESTSTALIAAKKKEVSGSGNLRARWYYYYYGNYYY